MRWNSRKKHRQSLHKSDKLSQDNYSTQQEKRCYSTHATQHLGGKPHSTKAQKRSESNAQIELSDEDALLKLISIHKDNPQRFHDYNRAQLRRQQRHIDILLNNEKVRLHEHKRREALRYRRCITDELQTRRQRTRQLLIALCIIVTIFIISLGIFMRGRKAELIKEQIYQSIYSQNFKDIQHRIQQAEQFISFIGNASLKLDISEAKAWLTRQQNQQKKGQKLLDRLEQKLCSIESLSEDESRSLAQLFGQNKHYHIVLHQRWKKLIAKAQNQQDIAKLQLIESIYTALPQPINFKGDIDRDERCIKSDISKLEQRIRLFDENKQFHGQPQHIVKSAQTRLKRREAELEELLKLKELNEKIDNIRDYQSYRDTLRHFNAKSYPLARAANQIWSILPRKEKLDELFKHHKKEQSYKESLATEQSIIHGAPSFSPAFPANAYNVALMEEVFEARSLKIPLYRAIAQKSGQSWLSDEPIEPAVLGKFTIKESNLSPNYRPGNNNEYSVDSEQGLKVYTINCKPFIQELQITRADFFAESNLASSVEAIIKSSHPNCPPLAKAYILQQVFKLIENYPHNDISGLAYSKTLQKDIDDFKHILKQHEITLNNISWLNQEKQYKAAESSLLKWYKKLEKRDYQREMKTQFLKTLAAKPSYVGYIQLDGKAKFHQLIPEGTDIWFVKKGAKGLHRAKQSELIQAAILSPILINAERGNIVKEANPNNPEKKLVHPK